MTYRTGKGNPILLAANWKKAKFRFSDNNLDFVEQEFANGTAVSTVPQIPLQWQLWPNYPNPFNPQTTISFALAEPAPVNIGIYNLQGALATELFNGQLPAGPHSLIWNATDFPAGTYFIQMQVKNRVRRSKCLLLK
ncbi:T9SS type A sorting domain-containing protein [candidate division KSB1 bacterium]|nr:T9SS type A sorting domain-containing protein [candidate division KSB1 bacterium]